MYDRLVRPVLFRLGGRDAETAHERTLRLLSLVPPVRPYSPPGAAREVFGVRFPNPVGLAAGMDKDGRALRAWPALGFGFIEVGTVTWHAQPGNERPRLHRLVHSGALVNRMGFNNAGARALAARLAVTRVRVPLGISLGKSKVTPLDEAVDDYRASYDVLRAHGDYFVVNVSSPNTPGLRQLQDKAYLKELLHALVGEKPILVKIAPDLTEPAIAEVVEVCLEQGAAGLVATNTTTGRTGLSPVDRPLATLPGGLSGPRLRDPAVAVVRFVVRETGGRLPVVGVGGITEPADAARFLDAGASLVQLYTGLVYQGPGLVRRAVRAVAA